MVDRKADDPAGPAGSRVWMGDDTGAKPKDGLPRERWDGQRNWLNRAPPSNARHAAITGSLHSWSSYKSWADRVKNSWDKDK
jgi:hypothetical protein